MFALKSVGHFLAVAAHDVKTGIEWMIAAEPAAETAAATVSLLDPQLAPLASTIERAGEALLGDALAIVSKVEADAEKGYSMPLTAETVADLKQLLAAIQKASPGAAAIPAGLPITAAS